MEERIKLFIDHDTSWNIDILILPLGSSVPTKQNSRPGHIQLPIIIPDSWMCETPVWEALRACLGISVASIALARLGLPNNRDEIRVHTEGSLTEVALKHLEYLLRLFVVSRTLVKFNSFSDVRVVVTCDHTDRYGWQWPRQETGALVAFSGGMDSAACLKNLILHRAYVETVFFDYQAPSLGGHSLESMRDFQAATTIAQKLLGHGLQTHHEVNTNLSLLDVIPHVTFLDTIDNDPWEYYGRNFLTACILTGLAYLRKFCYLVIGLDDNDLFNIDIYENRPIYGQCCQSAPFVLRFNSVLKSLFGKNSPSLVTPLVGMGKGSIARYLLTEPHSLFSATRSCIELEAEEDGTCFSCFDKISAAIAVAPQGECALIRTNKREWRLFWEGRPTASFVTQDPDNTPLTIWYTQLHRALSELPYISPELKNSKYHLDAVLAALWRQRSKLHMVFPEIEAKILRELFLKILNMLGAKNLGRIWTAFARKRSPRGLRTSLKELEARIDRRAME